MAAKKAKAKAPKKSAAKKTAKKAPAKPKTEKTRLWLTYPAKKISRPVIWELGNKYNLVTNIRQASVTHEIGILCLAIEGERAEIKKAVKWMESLGIAVEPVEINVIES